MRKLLLVVLLLVGCTKGGVWSAAETAAPVRAAVIEVSEVGADAPAQRVETATLGWGLNHFAFGPREANDVWAGASLAADRWYRYDVRREGYEPRVFYRYHPGFRDVCEFTCPDGSTNCCHHEDFSLWPVGTPHNAAPDLIVDPDVLAEQTYVQCVNLGDTADPEVIAVRSTVRVANIGDGDLRVESGRAQVACNDSRPCAPGLGCEAGICVPNVCDAGDRACPGELVCTQGKCLMPACIAGEECLSDRCGPDDRCEPVVEQRLSGASGKHDDLVRLETYMFNDGHTSELLAFAALHVVPTSCTKENPADCLHLERPNRTFCIEAEERFDPALEGDEPMRSFDACKAGTQVLGRGQAVTYGHDEPGQLFLLGTPAEARVILAEPLTVVASVDPADMLIERTTVRRGEVVEERHNNRARVPLLVQPIDDLTRFAELCRRSVPAACKDCVPNLDCSQCQAGERNGVIHRCAMAPNLTAAEEEMCGDYPPAHALTKRVATR